MVRIYGIRNCETMKKAMAWLSEHVIAYEFIDYKQAGVAAGRLPYWNAQAGWKLLLNTRGLMWKKLSPADRADVDEAKALALMAATPSLIKRPVVEAGQRVIVGFDANRYGELE